MRKWQGIVIHHSETTDSGMLSDFSSIKSFHVKQNGWADIGYHFVVEKVNNVHCVIAGRSLEMDGAHALGFNKTHIGICLVGSYDLDSPTTEAYYALKTLIETLKHTYNIPTTKIIGHRDTYSLRGVKPEKSCPGRRFDMSKVF